MKMLEQLREELAGSNGGLNPGARFAYAVPDTLDEFSQRTLRSAAHAAFGRAHPIWRSVALVLGWQQSSDFARAEVQSGDVVVVLDLLADGLSTTLLVARFDHRVQDRFPASKGLYWERRPCLSRRNLPEDLSEQAEELTLVALLRRYLHDPLQQMIAAGLLKEEAVLAFGDRLVRMGVGQAVVCHGRELWMPLGTASAEHVLHLSFDGERWTRLADLWCQALRHFLRELGETAIFGEMMTDPLGGRRACHLLFAGLPFSLSAVREGLSRPLSSPELREFQVLTCANSENYAAAGARHFLERLEAGLPSWRDCLPELYLEVIRGGHFHELQLMGEHLVDNEMVTGSLGGTLKIEVKERLILPPANNPYRFPLQVGHRRDRLPFDAYLWEEGIFPLAQDVEVRLDLSYRFGVDSAYELELLPVNPGAPIDHAVPVRWSRRIPARSEAPSFPGRRRRFRPQVEQAREWFLAKKLSENTTYGLVGTRDKMKTGSRPGGCNHGDNPAQT